MAVKERLLLVGGELDGTWVEVDHGETSKRLASAAGQSVEKALPAGLVTYGTYLRTEIDPPGEEPVAFMRISTMTVRQALLWMMAGHGKAGAQ